MGLPKCVTTKFSVIMREESFVHYCVGNVAVKVSVAIPVVNVKVLARTSTHLPLVSPYMRIFFIECGYSPFSHTLVKCEKCSKLAGLSLFEIYILVNSLYIFTRSLSYT